MWRELYKYSGILLFRQTFLDCLRNPRRARWRAVDFRSNTRHPSLQQKPCCGLATSSTCARQTKACCCSQKGNPKAPAGCSLKRGLSPISTSDHCVLYKTKTAGLFPNNPFEDSEDVRVHTHPEIQKYVNRLIIPDLLNYPFYRFAGSIWIFIKVLFNVGLSSTTKSMWLVQIHKVKALTGWLRTKKKHLLAAKDYWELNLSPSCYI